MFITIFLSERQPQTIALKISFPNLVPKFLPAILVPRIGDGMRQSQSLAASRCAKRWKYIKVSIREKEGQIQNDNGQTGTGPNGLGDDNAVKKMVYKEEQAAKQFAEKRYWPSFFISFWQQDNWTNVQWNQLRFQTFLARFWILD